MAERRLVIVGRSKPLLNYITACITLFNDGADEVTVRARGRAISEAVDVVQLLKSKFIKGISIKAMNVDGETVKMDNGKNVLLPVLEIIIKKEKRC